MEIQEVVYLHVDKKFPIVVKIFEKKLTDGSKVFDVKISQSDNGTHVLIECYTKRSAEILAYWFVRGMAHA